jgi:hypothetical protein
MLISEKKHQRYRKILKKEGSMEEMAMAGKDHGSSVLVSSGDNFLVTNRSAWLNRSGCS